VSALPNVVKQNTTGRSEPPAITAEGNSKTRRRIASPMHRNDRHRTRQLHGSNVRYGPRDGDHGVGRQRGWRPCRGPQQHDKDEQTAGERRRAHVYED
jgi:hypothetical protein